MLSIYLFCILSMVIWISALFADPIAWFLFLWIIVHGGLISQVHVCVWKKESSWSLETFSVVWFPIKNLCMILPDSGNTLDQIHDLGIWVHITMWILASNPEDWVMVTNVHGGSCLLLYKPRLRLEIFLSCLLKANRRKFSCLPIKKVAFPGPSFMWEDLWYNSYFVYGQSFSSLIYK